MMSLRRLLLILAIPFLSACGDDDPTGPDLTAHVGTYTMVSVNGIDLPANLGEFDGGTFEILEGRITLNADGTASDSFTYRYTVGTTTTQETVQDDGVYTRQNNSIVIQWASRANETYAFDEDEGELTATVEGVTGVWRK